MEQFLNEALLSGKGITLSDALSVGGMVTGVGISIVFAVLVILMLVLMLFYEEMDLLFLKMLLVQRLGRKCSLWILKMV